MFGKNRWIQTAAALIALLLLFLLPAGCTAGIKGFFRDIITPVQSLILKAGRSLKEGADTVRGFGGLAEENRRLSEEVIHLQARLSVLENLENENRRLREQLDFRNHQSRDLIACHVAARSVNNWWQSIRLDKGSRSGVRPDQAVIVPEGLVGRTSDVSAYSAEVLLLSDPACKISARVSRTGSFGIISGYGTNSKGYPLARMRFIHKDIPVKPGDEVVTSGLGGVFPKDLLIGYIEEVHMEETGLYQYADIIPKAVVELSDVVFVPVRQEEAE